MPDGVPDQHLLDKARHLAMTLAGDLEPAPGSAAPGKPLLVWTLDGRPAYWLFPLLDGETTIGALRLTLAGEMISLARRTPHGSATATGIDDGAALSRAKDAVAHRPGTQLSPPRLVMTDYPGREAWLVEVLEPDQDVRRLLISSGGVEELR
jgi:hypothetical protein